MNKNDTSSKNKNHKKTHQFRQPFTRSRMQLKRQKNSTQRELKKIGNTAIAIESMKRLNKMLNVPNVHNTKRTNHSLVNVNETASYKIPGYKYQKFKRTHVPYNKSLPLKSELRELELSRMRVKR